MFGQYGKTFLLALAATVLFPILAIAQDDGAAVGLSTGTSAEFGQHVTTSDGFAVYLYVEDGENLSTCADGCTNNWHPVLAGDDGEVAVDSTLTADLVSTFAREDGSIQISYAGHPLYTSRHDRNPGDVRGQAVGRGSFNLVSLAGVAITEAVEEEVVEIDPDILAQMVTDGGNTYRMLCVACHGDEGQGGVGPALANSAFVGDTNAVVNQVLNGFPDHGMPAFSGILDDTEISNLLTFIRASFGNEYGAVLVEEVEQRR